MAKPFPLPFHLVGDKSSSDNSSRSLEPFRNELRRKERPKLDDLNNHVVPWCASQWRELGVELKVGDHLMNNIQKDYPTDCETCCSKVLIEWLDSTPSASWDSLITAVDRLPPYESYVNPFKVATDRLREHYTQSRYTQEKDDWPPYQPKHYTPLTVIHHEKVPTESEIVNIAKQFSANKIMEENQSYINYNRTIRSISDLFDPYEGDTSRPYRILIEGAPGVGKTIFSKQIALQWAEYNVLKKKKLLFLLFMRDPRVKDITNLKSLVNYFCQGDTLTSKITDWLVETDGKYLVIILDGYDEVSEDNQSHFVYDIIQYKELTKCGVVITSRPASSSDLHHIVDCRAEVLGFSKEDRRDFIENSLHKEEDKINLENFLQSNVLFDTFCYIPLNMSILLCLTEDGIDTLPKTQTKLFEKFVIMTIVHFLKKDKKVSTTSIYSFDDLPHPFDQVVKELSQFAFIALQRDQLVYTKVEVKEACPNLTPSNWYGLGLLKPAKYFRPQDGSDHESFHFLYFAIQEYLAAYHISSLPDNTQLQLLKQTFWKAHYFNTWLMYVGITGGNNFVFKHFLSGNYFQLSSWLFGTPNISKSILRDKIKCFHLLHCLSEADHEMLSSVENIFQGRIIDLSHKTLSANDLRVLVIILLRSPNKYWRMINLSHCNIDDNGCSIFCQALQRADLNVKSMDVSGNTFSSECLNKLCTILRSWTTEKLILSVDSLYSSADIKVINCFTDQLRKQMGRNLVKQTVGKSLVGGFVLDKMMLVTYIVEEKKMIVVYSYGGYGGHDIYVYQFDDCELNDSMIAEKLLPLRKSRFSLSYVNKVAFSYVMTNVAKNTLCLLSNFPLVKLCGHFLHSKGVYTLNIATAIQYDHQFDLPYHYNADYVTAVIRHSKSNTSYLNILQPLKHNIESTLMLRSIYHLDVERVGIGSKSVEGILPMLPQHVLGELYMNKNNLETVGAIKLAKRLQTWYLTHFAISSNSIGCEAADDIANALSYTTKLKWLDISSNNFETSGAIKIAKALRETSHLTYLDLSDNNIGSAAADDIAAVLSCNTKLQTFFVEKNHLETDGVIKITRALQHTSSLRNFSVSGNDVGSEAVDDIASVISRNTKLTGVGVSGCSFGAPGGIKIVRALQNKSPLMWLIISDNNIGSMTADEIAAVLSYNTKLEWLCLGGNKLDTLGAIKIARALNYTSSLIEIDFSNNNIGSEAAKDIAVALSHNTKLQKLDLSRNKLETAGAIKIAKKLQDLSTLMELAISYNNIGSEAADDIAAVLHNNTKLKRLYIWENDLGAAGIAKIARAVQNISSLTETDMSSNIVDNETADDIATVLSQNTLLQKFDMVGYNMETDSANKIAKALQNNTSFIEFTIANNTIGSNAASKILYILAGNTKLQKFRMTQNELRVGCALTILWGLRNISSLTEFDISCNNIGSEVADDIATILSHNTKLRKFDMANNNLKTDGAIKIAGTLKHVPITSLMELNISSNNIGSKAADDIAAVISCNTKLLKFDMAENNLETDGVIKICKALQKTSSLKQFNISSNNFCNKVVDDIAAVLTCNTKLQEFSICKSNLGTACIIKIMKALRNTSCLTELDVSNNNISSNSANDIAAVLSHNTKLQKFFISGNELLTSGAIKISKALQNVPSLKEFSISSNSIGNEAADDIAVVLSHNTKLQKFSIAENNLDTSGGIVIAKALQGIVTLTELSIGSNDIGKAVDDFAVVLSSNMKLQVLQMCDGNLETEGAIKIARSLQNHLFLTEIDVSLNSIGTEAADDIAAVLSHNTQLQKLDIKGNDLQTSGIIKVVTALRNTSSLIELDMSSNNISNEAADDIAAVLSHNTKLQKFFVSDNVLQNSGLIKISKSLQNTSSLKEFSVSSNRIGNETADSIADILPHNTKLQKFDIKENNLDTSGVIVIAKALQSIVTLTELSIGSNDIGKAIDDFAVVLSSNMKLQVLQMCDGNLKTEGAITIARALQKHVSLREIDVSLNNIGSEAADDIAAVLSHNTQLQILNIKGNDLQTSGIIKVATALKNTSSLTEFNLSNNNIGCDAADDIAAVLSHNTQLQKFFIDGNILQTSGVIKIANAFHNTSSLKEFTISRNNVGSGAADDIATVLSHNAKLQKFDIKENDLETSGAITILKGLQNISSLLELDISSNNIHCQAVSDINAVLSNNPNLRKFSCS